MKHTASTGRLLGAALVATLVLSSVLGCSSSDDHGTPAGDIVVQSTLNVRLTSGADIRGAELELSFQPSLTLLSINQIGALQPATCEQNLAGQPALVACILDAADEFDSPATIWAVEFQHAFAVDVRASVNSLECAVSDQFGTVFPATCSIVN